MFSRRTINRWLREGIPERSWNAAIRELAPTAATAKRWARQGIPERTLRKLESSPGSGKVRVTFQLPKSQPSVKARETLEERWDDEERDAIVSEDEAPPISDSFLIDYGDLPQVKVFDEEFDEYEAEEEPDYPGDDYDIGEEYDIDYWEELAEYYEDLAYDFSDFEKLS